ncbi:MAG: sulfatase-like hydrolase/transferase [Candidatus Omnitrophica bacterium]|nr:sulfatase-like hydrolase/transferase [Candidatus Omnitrophota bacterium]
MVQKTGLVRGFDEFYDPSTLELGQDFRTVRSEVIVHKAIEILKKYDNQENAAPVFLWTFFKDPHWAYLPPQGYREKFLNDDLYMTQREPVKINKDFYDSMHGVGEARLRSNERGFIHDKAYYIAQYDSEIAYMDKSIGTLLSFIGENNDNWMIILVADHGESLGENDYYFDHGYLLDEASINNLLAIKFPNTVQGVLRNDCVAIYDIYPTIADMLNVPIKKCDGNSLLRDKNISGRMIMLENSQYHEKDEAVKLYGCILDSYKLIYNKTRERFSFATIHQGRENVIEEKGAYQKIINKMQRAIRSLSHDSKDDKEEQMQKLKSFGYL